MWSRTGRVASLSVLSLSLVMTAGACAGSEASGAPVITILPQSFETRPPVTVVPESTTAATAGEDGTTDQVQHYTVQAGDFPSNIASKFEVSLQALIGINDWELVDGRVPSFPGEGAVIEIPPGAKFIDSNASSDDDDEDETDSNDETDSTTAATTEDGSRIETTGSSDGFCSYTIQSGEYPSGIASKFGISLNELLRANGWTLSGNMVPEYPGAGAEIKIPVDPEGQTYVIQPNEYPSAIASKFGVSLNELLEANDWTLVGNRVPEYPGAGAEIKIPASSDSCG